MTDELRAEIAYQLQQIYDSIQDGDTDEALNDIKAVCDILQHPIHDERSE